MSATPIRSRKASASIFVVGLRLMKSATGPDATYITPIATMTAAIITSMSSAMPTAVRMESTENTASISTS